VKVRMIKNYSDLLRFGQIYSDDWVLINGVRAKSLRISAIWCDLVQRAVKPPSLKL
jgi:hypothetical protein